MVTFDDIAERVETGPLIPENEFVLQKVSVTVSKLVQEHHLSFSQDAPFVLDADMADRMWDAGLKLLSTIGVYSSGNRRTVLFGEEEIQAALKKQVATEVGQGRDRRSLYPRRPGERRS
ncbi:MAG: monomethylamine:corrinoid methyltransferase, partial [Candidatus Ranarchaeia archaeon]